MLLNIQPSRNRDQYWLPIIASSLEKTNVLLVCLSCWQGFSQYDYPRAYGVWSTGMGFHISFMESKPIWLSRGLWSLVHWYGISYIIYGVQANMTIQGFMESGPLVWEFIYHLWSPSQYDYPRVYGVWSTGMGFHISLHQGNPWQRKQRWKLTNNHSILWAHHTSHYTEASSLMEHWNISLKARLKFQLSDLPGWSVII